MILAHLDSSIPSSKLRTMIAMVSTSKPGCRSCATYPWILFIHHGSSPRKNDGSLVSNPPKPKSPWIPTPRILWSNWTRGSSITIVGMDRDPRCVAIRRRKSRILQLGSVTCVCAVVFIPLPMPMPMLMPTTTRTTMSFTITTTIHRQAMVPPLAMDRPLLVVFPDDRMWTLITFHPLELRIVCHHLVLYPVA